MPVRHATVTIPYKIMSFRFNLYIISYNDLSSEDIGNANEEKYIALFGMRSKNIRLVSQVLNFSSYFG